PPRSTLFPYTTLFRSLVVDKEGLLALEQQAVDDTLNDHELVAGRVGGQVRIRFRGGQRHGERHFAAEAFRVLPQASPQRRGEKPDRKSTRLNSSHVKI